MKIAMCFYGELRSLEFLNSDYTSNTHFDFFISAGTGKYNSDDINIDFKYSNFELDNEQSPIKVKNLVHNDRVAKACYHINKVVRLKERYEIENKFAYDVVILLRTDFKYDIDYLLKYCKKVYKVSNEIGIKPVCFVRTQPDHLKGKEDKGLGIAHDDLFIHNNEGANLHANLYNSLFLQKNADKTKIKFDDITDNGHCVQCFLLTKYPFHIIFDNTVKWTKKILTL
jgi:hypothetical protein